MIHVLFFVYIFDKSKLYCSKIVYF